MNIWFASMECAGIAEAGGVKNVTFSLCKEFSQAGHEVTLFIPVFKCTSFDLIKDLMDVKENQKIFICGKEETVKYQKAVCTSGNFNVVFVEHKAFEEKEAVYTYTANEQKKNPLCIKGHGHTDTLFMDTLFQKAVCSYAAISSDLPQIIHCQDAATASLPSFAKQTPELKNVKCVVTIHNAGPAYHHEFSSLGEAAWYTGLSEKLLSKSLNNGKVEPFLLAINSKAFLSTVSEQYAKEITDPLNADITENLSRIFAKMKVEIKGITNGFDFERYDPTDAKKSKLPYTFNPLKFDLEGKRLCKKYFVEKIANSRNFKCEGLKKFGTLECSKNLDNEIFIAYHGRITTQKGISVLVNTIPTVLSNFDNVSFIVAGQGESDLENSVIELTKAFPGKVIFMNGYNQEVVRLLTASSDFITLPSFFEPCGLEDFIAQAYATVPIAHRTGGLTKIKDLKTGYLYNNNNEAALSLTICRAICIKQYNSKLHEQIIKNGAESVQKEYLWKNVIEKKYLPYFEEILNFS